jgi:hypothetical protein
MTEPTPNWRTRSLDHIDAHPEQWNQGGLAGQDELRNGWLFRWLGRRPGRA